MGLNEKYETKKNNNNKTIQEQQIFRRTGAYLIYQKEMFELPEKKNVKESSERKIQMQIYQFN